MFDRFGYPLRTEEDYANEVLSQAQVIGQGFDIYGQASLGSLMEPLFDFSTLPTKDISFQGKTVKVPITVNWIAGGEQEILEDYGVSRSSFQEKISRRFGVSTSVGAFSGEVQSSFSTSDTLTSELNYAYVKLYSPMGIFQYQPGHEEYLTTEFKQAVEHLPALVTEKNFTDFEAFFNRFGIYFVTQASPGAQLTYGVTVSKSSGLRTEDYAASAKASYKALFANVSISSDFSDSKAWSDYKASAQVKISTRGGEAELAAKLKSSDPFNPSTAATYSALMEWLRSATANPTNIDFRVSGIWEFAGAKRDTVQAAWELFSRYMRPTLRLTATGYSAPTEQAPIWPLIQLNDQKFVMPEGSEKMGIDVLILDGRNFWAKPLFMRRFGIDANRWFLNYDQFWNDVQRAICASGAAVSPNLLIIASCNFEWNMPPTSDMTSLLGIAGAKHLNENWFKRCTPGRPVSIVPGSPMVVHPANILFAGTFNGAFGSAVESYHVKPSSTDYNQNTITIVFNRQTSGEPFGIEAVVIEQ